MNNLRNWLIEQGFTFEAILDGKWHRFDRNGKKDKSCYFIGREIKLSDGKSIIVATVGDWKTNEKLTFKSFEGNSKIERKKISNAIKAFQEDSEKLLLEQQKRAAKEAKNYFEKYSPQGTTPYLQRKLIPLPNNCRIDNDPFTNGGPVLIVPMQNIDGVFVGVQRILQSGEKFFFKNQTTKGCFFSIGEIESDAEVVVCEGLATGMSIYLATKKTIIVAFNAYNLLPVCEALIQRYPQIKIIIGADEDLWTKKQDGAPYNPGRENAKLAAQAVGAAIAFPLFKNLIEKKTTDFNDLHVMEGLDAVKEQFSNLKIGEGAALRQILITGRQLTDIIADTWKEIGRQNRSDPKLFQYDGSLLRIIKGGEGKLHRKIAGVDDIFGHAVRSATWIGINKSSEPFHSKPPKDIARDLLVYPDENLPTLESIVRVPVMSRQGTLIRKPGYHRSEAIFADPSGSFDIPDIPDRPSKADIEASANFLIDELLGDFPFIDQLDRAHAVAAIILPFIRRIINGPTPLHSVEAPDPGTGKGLFSDIVSIVFTGAAAQVRSLPATDDEIRKAITAELLQDEAIFLIDNVTSVNKYGEIDSASLAAALTTTRWTDRILGLSKMASLPNLRLWMMTANNPKFSDELYRRRVPIRMDRKIEMECRKKGFRHPLLKKWALENRMQLIYSALVLIQAWISEGRPSSNCSLASYEDWSSVLGSILEIARIDGFLGHRQWKTKAENEYSDWENLVGKWWEQYGSNSILPSEINQLCGRLGILTELRGTNSQKSQETKIGNALLRLTGCVFGKFTIILAEDQKNHGKRYTLIPIDQSLQKMSREHPA